jgi:hypothetical protein
MQVAATVCRKYRELRIEGREPLSLLSLYFTTANSKKAIFFLFFLGFLLIAWIYSVDLETKAQE